MSIWKARLQLRKVAWYWVRAANRSPTHSSVRSRSAEKYPGRPSAFSRSRKPASKAADLDHWWLTWRPSCSSVGTEADHSLDITTVSRSLSVAASTAIAEMMPVTGTWPLRKPSSAERSNCGSISRPARRTGRPLTAAGRSIAANRSPGRLTTKSTMSSVRLRMPSTVTIESMPPPKGMSGRRPPCRVAVAVSCGGFGCGRPGPAVPRCAGR